MTVDKVFFGKQCARIAIAGMERGSHTATEALQRAGNLRPTEADRQVGGHRSLLGGLCGSIVEGSSVELTDFLDRQSATPPPSPPGCRRYEHLRCSYKMLRSLSGGVVTSCW